MIATIIILAIAFTWLGYESKWFTIRLESTEYQKAVIAKVNHDVNHDSEADTEADEENKIPYRPSEFVPADMPEFTGKLNIVCKIE